ncbi:hypothetical protein GGH14_000254 [Coemansia sp. RSA 370]|nr:hypothetical protein GGH14_000254 [Coemansia sp. RSA 370]
MTLTMVGRLLDADRVQAAAERGIQLDPIGDLDTATIAAGSALFGVSFIMIVYSWCNHRYQPIRAKNLPQTTLLFVCGVLWFVGDIATNGHISMQFRGWKLFAPYIGAALCVLLFCAAGQIVSPSVTIKYDPSLELCMYSYVYRTCGLALQWAMWALVFVFMWLVRNIQPSFNEVRESLVIAMLTLLSLVQNTVMESIHSPVAAHKMGRNASTWIDFLDANLTIWVILGFPVYQSISNRKTYLMHWRAKLADDGFRREYNISANGEAGETTMYSLHTRPNSAERSKHSSVWLYQGMYENGLPHQDSALMPGQMTRAADITVETAVAAEETAVVETVEVVASLAAVITEAMVVTTEVIMAITEVMTEEVEVTVEVVAAATAEVVAEEETVAEDANYHAKPQF